MAFAKLENYIGAGTIDQWESVVQPMNQWGNKEGRQIIWQRTPINRISPICFHINRMESGKDDRRSQRLIFKSWQNYS